MIWSRTDRAVLGVVAVDVGRFCAACNHAAPGIDKSVI